MHFPIREQTSPMQYNHMNQAHVFHHGHFSVPLYGPLVPLLPKVLQVQFTGETPISLGAAVNRSAAAGVKNEEADVMIFLFLCTLNIDTNKSSAERTETNNSTS